MTVTETRPALKNLVTGTEPCLLHANGGHRKRPNPLWGEIKTAFFDQPARNLGPHPMITVITANNGSACMGLFERGLDHFGIPYIVGGGPPEHEWINAIHKPLAIWDALSSVSTPFVLFGDSRDVLLITSLDSILDRYQRDFRHRLVFGAEMYNFPPNEACLEYEQALYVFLAPLAHLRGPSPFRFLNSGMWFGPKKTALTIFSDMKRWQPLPEAEWSDQGKLKRMLPDLGPYIQLDYNCVLFQNNVKESNRHLFELRGIPVQDLD